MPACQTRGILWVDQRGKLHLPSLIKLRMQFSRIRLSDVLHRNARAFLQSTVVGALHTPCVS